MRGLFFDKTPTVELEPPLAPGPDDRGPGPPGRTRLRPLDAQGRHPARPRPGGAAGADGDDPPASRRLRTGERSDAGPARLALRRQARPRRDRGLDVPRRRRWRSIASSPPAESSIMRPLLLHASASGTGPGRRRVIHLEYAAEDLPGGLEWYQPESAINPSGP